MKIVKFNNDKYGVRIGNWLTGYKFLSKQYYSWTGIEHVMDFCQFETIEEAQMIIENNPIKYKLIKRM
jgi:hypothetical protein